MSRPRPKRTLARAPVVGEARPALGTVGPAGALSVTATEAKNRFGPLLEAAIKGSSVVITRHNAPKAVLLSMAEFEALTRGRDAELATLSAEFDTMLAGMQGGASRAAAKAAFNATPHDLGKLAVAGARRRG